MNDLTERERIVVFFNTLDWRSIEDGFMEGAYKLLADESAAVRAPLEQRIKDAAITIANLEEGIDELAAQNNRLLAALREAKDQIARASIVEPCLVSAATTIRVALADNGEASHGL